MFEPTTRRSARATDSSKTYVRLEGEIDVAAVPRLRSDLLGASEKGSGTIVLDAANLEFIDAAAIGVLVDLHNRLAGDGRRVRIENLPRARRRVFEILEVTSMFGIGRPTSSTEHRRHW